MSNPAAIHCSNPHCQTANHLDSRFCAKCRTPLVKRYLWAVGTSKDSYQPGTVVDSRYLFIEPSVVIDLKPALVPLSLEEVPPKILPYLRLAPYSLHIPQVYGLLPEKTRKGKEPIWLLEYGNFPSAQGELRPWEELLVPLQQAWPQATALRQINWLKQMSKLWQPLQSQEVASSLINPDLLLTNGSVFKLRELSSDKGKSPSVTRLGQLWSSWIDGASPVLQKFLEKLCTKITQQNPNPSQVNSLLDQAAWKCGRSQQRRYSIYTVTDAGPSRDHNEDACYPASNSLVTPEFNANATSIVCDGIGGHEGGEVASELAIEKMLAGIETLSAKGESLSPHIIWQSLEKSTCAANDAISDVNDQEQRYERQRMGTTMVATFIHRHEAYLTHVGDSRIYLIAAKGCHQLTLDDDVASREVRLGYSLYRSAVQYPSAGSLVQALGMGASNLLHPTVQRLILDEDVVLLLCSDGLSDFDRVEQYWETEILPILQGRKNVTEAAKRLVKVANEKNGHDNVTVALVHCQVEYGDEINETALAFPAKESFLPPPSASNPSPAPETRVQTNPTILQPDEEVEEAEAESTSHQRGFPWGVVVAVVILLLALAGLGLTYLLNPSLKGKLRTLVGIPQEEQNPATPSPSATVEASPEISPGEALTFGDGDFVEISQAINLQEKQGETTVALGSVPAGSILQVSRTFPTSNFIELKLCQLPQTSTPTPTTSPGSPTPPQVEETKFLPPGTVGLTDEEQLQAIATQLSPVNNQVGSCVPSPPSSPSP